MRLAVALVVAVLAGCQGAPVTPPSESLAASAPNSTVESSPLSPSPAPTLDLATLEGRILFTRAGGEFGDETIFTANADGSNARIV